jgi:hypothetical protein
MSRTIHHTAKRGITAKEQMDFAQEKRAGNKRMRRYRGRVSNWIYNRKRNR